MRVTFASGRNYLPDRVDGAILSVHTLLELLEQRSHECEVIAGISADNPLRSWTHRARRLLTRRRVLGWVDSENGYPTHRAWEAQVPRLLTQRIAAFRPDIVLTQLEGSEAIAAAAVQASIPAVLFVRDAEFAWHRGGVADHPFVLLLSSSRFVAERVAERIGREAPCLYPIVQPQDYLVAARTPRFVTFVNPVREKGLEVALEVAGRLPHREFLFVETWPLRPDLRRELRKRLATLPNVHLRGRTLDMREVYGQTALLLAPSQWKEAFGRVLLEAQVNGIPVVASRIGGIPEALRSGGVLLAPTESPAEWARAVEEILADRSVYAGISEESRRNAMREDFNPAALVERFLGLAEGHLRQCRSLPAADRAAREAGA